MRVDWGPDRMLRFTQDDRDGGTAIGRRGTRSIASPGLWLKRTLSAVTLRLSIDFDEHGRVADFGLVLRRVRSSIRKREVGGSIMVNSRVKPGLVSFVTAAALLLLFSAPAAWKPADGPLMTKWAQEVSPEKALPEYPRPQMVRRNWLNLNGLWDYAIRPKDAAKPDSFDVQLLVPFPIRSEEHTSELQS